MEARLSLILRILTCCALLVLGIACNKAPDDAKVTSDIQAKLAADSGLQDKQLTVQTANGTVTLAGSVDSQAERDAAAKYATSEPGVRTVINNLQIGPEAAAAQTSATRAFSKPRASTRHHRAEEQTQMAASNSPPNQSQQVAAPTQPGYVDPPPMQAPPAPAPPPQPTPVTVPSGAVLSVRLIDTIDSATAQAGDTFHATLDAPLAVDGDVVVPAHYDVEGHVVNAQASGKFAGQALLALTLDRLKVGGNVYPIETDQFSQKTSSRTKNTAEKVGAGAVAGAILGGIFGGGKGAAIGSAAGAGAGGGVQAASKKPDIKLSSEKVLTFALQTPVTLVPTTKPARDGQKLAAPNSQ
ncbi:MAG TPA: BON domain-containing protein [Terriglobales bacterium]|nr:BON domain-containing protein [Terriglobales bacterium]